MNWTKTTTSIINLIILILLILYIEHIFSCVWYFVADWQEVNGQNNWMSAFGIESETWEIKYLNGFYFSTVTMLSVGYGDIVP